ncbi:hypothetical protein KEM55_002089 [Ascosphaera atra]|nr:hypothetical protein KEM55_002089 [Ascosphaera atra]
MATNTLYQNLSRPLLPVIVDPHSKDGNVTSYDHTSIDVQQWQDFNVSTVYRDFGHLLDTQLLHHQETPFTAPRSVYSEAACAFEASGIDIPLEINDGTLGAKSKADLAIFDSRGTLYERASFVVGVNTYMKEEGTDFGFVISDSELIAVKRLSEDARGVTRLAVAEPVGWTDGSDAQMPQMSIALAVWYLAMLSVHGRV